MKKWFNLSTLLGPDATMGETLWGAILMVIIMAVFLAAIFGVTFIPRMIHPTWVGVVVSLAATVGLLCLYVHIIVPNKPKSLSSDKSDLSGGSTNVPEVRLSRVRTAYDGLERELQEVGVQEQAVLVQGRIA
jgi:hypothetical protein